MAAPVSELGVDAGYEAWAAIYDEMSNALIRAEEPPVDRALADVAPGDALDAACGTGRHVARLVARVIKPSGSTGPRPCWPRPGPSCRQRSSVGES